MCFTFWNPPRRSKNVYQHRVSKDGGSVRFKLHSKVAALDALAKYLGIGDAGGDDGEKHLHLHFENLTLEELRSLASR